MKKIFLILFSHYNYQYKRNLPANFFKFIKSLAVVIGFFMVYLLGHFLANLMHALLNLFQHILIAQ